MRTMMVVDQDGSAYRSDIYIHRFIVRSGHSFIMTGKSGEFTISQANQPSEPFSRRLTTRVSLAAHHQRRTIYDRPLPSTPTLFRPFIFPILLHILLMASSPISLRRVQSTVQLTLRSANASPNALRVQHARPFSTTSSDLDVRSSSTPVILTLYPKVSAQYFRDDQG